MALRYLSGLRLDPTLMRINPRTGRSMFKSLDVQIEPTVGILARRVDKLGLDIRSFKEPLTRAVKEVMIPSIRTNFLKSGRPRWEDLKEETWARKTGRGILRETDSLMRVMGQLNIWHIDSEMATIPDLPTRVWYGKVHQGGKEGFASSMATIISGEGRTAVFGSVIVGEVPQRPFIMMQKEDEEAIEEIFDEWLGERIQKAGLGNKFESQRIGPF